MRETKSAMKTYVNKGIVLSCRPGCSDKYFVLREDGWFLLPQLGTRWMDPRDASTLLRVVACLAGSARSQILRARSNRMAIVRAISYYLKRWKDAKVAVNTPLEARVVQVLLMVTNAVGVRLGESDLVALEEEFDLNPTEVTKAKRMLRAILAQYDSGFKPHVDAAADRDERVLLQHLHALEKDPRA